MTMSASKILIVEDEETLLEALRYNLEKEGYTVVTAVDGIQALDSARSESPDLIILDIMLPQLDGFEVCRILRKNTSVPILMLTAKDEEMDKVIGLELGADDYMVKPFSMRELNARIKAILRRAAESQREDDEDIVLQVGDLTIDQVRHRVAIGEAVVSLKPKEFDLLVFLARNKGRVFSREHLLERVWGYDYFGDTRTVDVHIRWLREKIEPDPSRPRRLITVRGTGYKIEG
jgi:two-component system OmpR family response regulator